MFGKILRQFFKKRETPEEIKVLRSWLKANQLSHLETDLLRTGKMLIRARRQLFRTLRKAIEEKESKPEDKMCIILSSILTALEMFMELVPPSERRNILQTLGKIILEPENNHQCMYG